MYKLFMNFENPTEKITGTKQSVQGFSVYKNYGVILYHTGIGAVYNLETKDKKPMGTFYLGSYNTGIPDNRYTNHANDVMFGGFMDGEEFPLMYVTAGNSGESDEKGLIAYCAVEQLRYKNGEYTSETIQRIYYKNDGIENTAFLSPGWGWPAFLVDIKGGYYYMFSAKYRTRRDLAKDDNVYIVTKFRLPDPKVGDVTLNPKDIVDQFTLPFNVFFTQGGTIYDGKIYYTFGLGNEEHPDALRVINLETKDYELLEDLSKTPFGNDEIECCGFYNGRLLINTQHGSVYEREEFEKWEKL